MAALVDYLRGDARLREKQLVGDAPLGIVIAQRIKDDIAVEKRRHFSLGHHRKARPGPESACPPNGFAHWQYVPVPLYASLRLKR